MNRTGASRIAPSTKSGRSRRSAWLWGSVVLAALFLNGCFDSQGDNLTGPSGGAGGAGAFQPPSVDEVAAAVPNMTAAQRAQMSAALDDLGRAMAAMPRHERHSADGGPAGASNLGRRTPAEGSAAGPEEREAPFLSFVEAGAQALDTNQFTAFAKFLAARRASADKAGGGAHRFHGGPGGGAAPGGPGGGGFLLGRILRENADQLALTSDQRDRLQALVAPTKASFEALLSAREKGASDDQLHAQGADLRKKVEAQVAAILDAGQNAKLQQLITARRAQFADAEISRLGARTTQHLDFLTKTLALTPAQTAQVRTILSGTEAQRKAELEAVKSGQAAPEDLFAKGGPAQRLEKTSGAVRAVLTPDQAARYDALRLLVPGHRPS